MKKILLLVFLWSCCAFVATAQKSLSLQDCLELITTNNLQYREGVLQIENATAQLRQVESQRLPQVGAGMSQNLNFGRSIDRFTNAYIDQVYHNNWVGANVQIPLFQGFQIQNQIKQSTTLQQAAEQNKVAILYQQQIRLLQAYIQVLSAEALHQAALQQVATTVQQVERVEKQLNAGTVGSQILYEIKAQLANDQFEAVTARNNYQQARLVLFQILNITPDLSTVFLPLTDMADSKAAPSVQVLFDQLAESFPDVKVSAIRAKSFDYQWRAVRSGNLPSVSLSGSYGAFYASTNEEKNYFRQLDKTRNGGLNLNLGIPIFGGWFTKPRLEAVRVQQRIANNQLNLAKQRLRQDLELVVQQQMAAQERHAAAQQQRDAQQANLSAVQSRLEAGTAHVFEYNLAKNNLARAEANAIRAKYELILQNRLIDFYTKMP